MAGYTIHLSLSYFLQVPKFGLHVEPVAEQQPPVCTHTRSSSLSGGVGVPGRPKEGSLGHARKEHGWSCSSTRFQDLQPRHTLPLRSVPAVARHSGQEVRRSRRCLSTSPSSHRFPTEDEPAAQQSNSWNQEALKPILS